MRRRAWPKLAGLHERLWEDVTRSGGKHVTFGFVETREHALSNAGNRQQALVRNRRVFHFLHFGSAAHTEEFVAI